MQLAFLAGMQSAASSLVYDGFFTGTQSAASSLVYDGTQYSVDACERLQLICGIACILAQSSLPLPAAFEVECVRSCMSVILFQA